MRKLGSFVWLLLATTTFSGSVVGVYGCAVEGWEGGCASGVGSDIHRLRLW